MFSFCKKNVDECLLCLNKDYYYFYSNLQIYTPKMCNCKFKLHPKCYYEWLNFKNNCPICLKSLYINKEKLKEYSSEHNFTRSIISVMYITFITNFHKIPLLCSIAYLTYVTYVILVK